ncbi:hypothetical protein DMC25_14785 [Caulobacter sp. D4A]|uniref:DUF1003 domain-containing protein n=1 Tax=unclassified Caulobacter TaxID=2648921 RepID=UPI000D72FC17|nr:MULTISPECIES: DUF1003 domain-containing protein [unclassified Caulobacter]PXA85765.1 hypothetical protein DMC25_14785 [Caulobacter sp. D4A]PXA86676.1 hypothetical protein DMC18_21765 [Caulobacter sp. D5]
MSAEKLDHLSRTLLGGSYGDLTEVQRSVIDLIAAEAPTAVAPSLREKEGTYWERLADKVAAIGGSWGFIGSFSAILAAWVILNLALMPFHKAFDPYPFIFLNLVLSTLAAIQAPIIMMSQNRQATKDREAAEHDYVVNLRAELEIMRLHDKLDALRVAELSEMARANAVCLDELRAEVRALRG